MVFSVPSFVGVGDDFDKEVKKDKKPGRTFLAGGPKKGNGPDALFGKQFQSIHEGDPYVDPGTLEKRNKREKAKKCLTSNGFRLASPPKKPTGPGDFHGTFDEKPLVHETDYVVPRKGESPPRKQPAPRQVYTAPTAKGGFGFPKTTLSAIGTDYVADFYDAPREAAKRDLEKHKQLVKGAPWKGASRRGYTFDEGSGTGASKCYTQTKPMPPRKPTTSNASCKGPDSAWRPGGIVPKRLPPVEYREDPFDGFDPREANKKRTKPDTGKPGWRPAANQNDTWYTKSIAFARL